MGFGGAVSAMLTSLKNNKRTRTTRFDDKPKSYYHSTIKKEKLVFKKLNDQDLAEAKKQIQTNSRDHNKKVLIYTIVAIILLSLFVYLLIIDSGRSFI